jgi:S1-C subfamily serine protease
MKGIAMFFSLLALILLAGCVSMNEEKITPEAPVKLYPAGKLLKGLDPTLLYVESQLTIPDVPLQSRTIQRVAELAGPAVVSIYVRTETPVKVRLLPVKLPFTGIPAKLPGIGLGSGFFIHPDGYVLSNEHVVRNSSEIRVMTQNGTDYVARVVATDPVYDLALLKVDSPNTFRFAFLPMGDSAAVRGGDHVIAVGNPLGFGHTVTAGIISHTGRSLFEEPDAAGRYVSYLQTDAAINPGSSGGPLITLSGAWIGLNTAQITNTQGIGFTVPSNQVREFLDNILAGIGAIAQ